MALHSLFLYLFTSRFESFYTDFLIKLFLLVYNKILSWSCLIKEYC